MVSPRIRKFSIYTGAVITAALVFWATAAEYQHRENLKTAQLHLQRGIHLHEQKAYVPAKSELILALRADPEDWQAPYYLGAGNLELKRYDAAIPFLERALTLAPSEQKIYKTLGVAYYKLGKLDMARGYFTAYQDLDPNNMDAWGLVELMAKLQRNSALAATEETN